MSERDPEQRGFTVVDRRASAGAADAEPEPAAGERSAAEARPPAAETGARAGDLGPDAAAEAFGERVPTVDFPMLIVSFAEAALYHMGLVADRESGRPGPVDLAAARQNIEILELIERKTRGNLEPEEARMIEDLLYQLRMSFVQVSSGPPRP